jgi:hypothetical protein
MNLVIHVCKFNTPRICDDGTVEAVIVNVKDTDFTTGPQTVYSGRTFATMQSAKIFAEGIQIGLKLLNKNEVPILFV